jgi:hypothetical protein
MVFYLSKIYSVNGGHAMAGIASDVHSKTTAKVQERIITNIVIQ